MRSNAKKTAIQNVTKLVFNGGGAKGAAHPMAYAAFIACGGDIEQVTDVAGTSAGSIMAGMVALGYTSEEIHRQMSKDFMDFLDEDSGLIKVSKKVRKTTGKLQAGKNKAIALGPLLIAGPKIKERIEKNLGIFKGEALRLWVEEKIKTKLEALGLGLVDHCTFLELHELSKQNRKIKDLHVVSLNANTQVIEYFNYKNTPNVILSDAIRASSSIPMFFEAHQICFKDQHRRRVAMKDRYLDGGVINNYPINIFNSFNVNPNEVLGFYLCDSLVADYLKGVGPLPGSEEITSGMELLKNTIGSIYDQQYASFMADEQAKRCTIPIDNTGISTVDFDLSNRPDDLNKLLQSGWQATCDYFGKAIPFPPLHPIALFARQVQDYHEQHKAIKNSNGWSQYMMLAPVCLAACLIAVSSKELSTKDWLVYAFAIIGLAALLKMTFSYRADVSTTMLSENSGIFRCNNPGRDENSECQGNVQFSS